MPLRFFVGILSFLLLVALACNMLEGENTYVTGAPLDSELIDHSFSVSTTSSGTNSNFITMGIDWIDKYLLFHYSVFYDVDPVTGTQAPNDFVIIRYMCIIMMVGLLINLFVLFRASALSV